MTRRNGEPMNENDKYIGRMLDDRYEILDVIGEGGMAVVYKALCHRLNRNVAIKIMRDETAADEEFRSRFCAESQAVAMLSHPNIVAVYDVSHNDEIEYIVMELINGITLKQYMDKKGALDWKETVHFTKQITKALSHAHERGIIHRDIKPQNIMLLRDGTIKVADFGIAALENELYENNGQAIGSIHYIAPEQARGEMPDARSDVYSLGVVMYEMLTGKLPYTGETIGEIALKHMSGEFVLPHEIDPFIPPELEAIALKAMKANIDERYQTASALLDDLDAFTAEQARLESEVTAREEKENPAVMPVRSVSELSKEKFKHQRRRSGKVSFLTGTFGALAVIVALIAFLWGFWLNDVFSPAERIELPSFVGSYYNSVINNAELMAEYNFNVTYVVDETAEVGMIVSQSPDAGSSMMVVPSGIVVDITVNSGAVPVAVPEVNGMDYREAVLQIKNAGFLVEIESQTSDTVERDRVISTSPNSGEKISTGSTVYITVSSGTQISYVKMPNLIGSTEDAAIIKLENTNLSYGGSTVTESDLEAGTVIGQTIPAFTDVEEHTKIYLTVSSGPAA